MVVKELYRVIIMMANLRKDKLQLKLCIL